MPDVDTSSPLQRQTPPRHRHEDHFVALCMIFGLSLTVAAVLQVVPLVVPLMVVCTAIYFAVITTRMWLKTLICCVLFFGVLVLCLPTTGAAFLSESAVGLVAGWWRFLGRTLPNVTVSAPNVATFTVLIVLLTLGVHFVARRLIQQRRDESVRRAWSIRQSLRFVCLFALSFVAGLACVGAVQQSGWLMNSPTPALDYQDGGMLNRPRLHDLGSALFDARDEEGRFPIGIMSQDGHALHGWQTLLLPHLGHRGLYDQIHLQQSWRAPANRNALEQVVVGFQSRKFRDQLTTAEGYSASHFAANMRVIGPGGGITADEITDGDSRTILAGEVAENFRAWGDPFNVRDPGLGLNHPDGFASPWSSGNSRLGIFLFADGHVQSIHDDVDPAIFEALGTPNAGDEVGEF